MPVTVKWILKKAKTRPEAYLRSYHQLAEVVLTYLPRKAWRVDTKDEAKDWARIIYDMTGIAWEPVAITVEEDNQ